MKSTEESGIPSETASLREEPGALFYLRIVILGHRPAGPSRKLTLQDKFPSSRLLQAKVPYRLILYGFEQNAF